ncbi:MerR family DNA-binding transcriptional regulator [Nocardia sp. PE-7]
MAWITRRMRMRIGELARRTGVSTRALRYWR